MQQAKKKSTLMQPHNAASSINSTKGVGYKVSSKYQQMIKNQMGSSLLVNNDMQANSDLYNLGS
jgi:hypothetical protein